MSDDAGGVFLTLPLPDEHVFRYQAADDILELLYRNPHREFTITQLRSTTGHGGKSVDSALQILDSLGLVQLERDGRHTRVSINQQRIQRSDDPLLEIPQHEFRAPVKAFLDELDDTEIDIAGAILFGSVARGEADRTSDVDIQIVVDGEVTTARREIQSLRQNVEQQTFGGNRYEFQVLVESIESASGYGEKLQDVFSEGITLYETEALDTVREAVFDGEQ